MNLYKRIFLYCGLIYIFFLFPSINQSIYITSSSNQILELDNIEHVEKKEYLKYYHDFKKQDDEGFAEGTLISTNNGLKPIEDLKINDSIYSSNTDDRSQFIKHILPKLIANYIKIKLKDKIIKASVNQLFYDANKHCWTQACDLRKGDSLLKANDDVDSIEIIDCKKIDEPVSVYALTTSSSTYHVTDDNIYVHNADVLRVIAINPILALLGAKTSFKTTEDFSYLINQSKGNMINNQRESLIIVQKNNIYELETEYYLKRKKELLTLKEDCLNIKKAIEKSIKIDLKVKHNFTANYLGKIKISDAVLNNIMFSVVNNASDQYIQEIREKREKELNEIEEKIIEVQICIVSHFDGLMDRVENAFKKYQQLVLCSNRIAVDWNMHTKNMTIKIAVENYESTIEGLSFIDYIGSCMKELWQIVAYYNSYKHLPLIAKTTNILEILKPVEQNLFEKERYLKIERDTLLRSKQNEESFLQSKVVVYSFLQKNVENKVKKDLDKCESELLLCAKNNRSSLMQVRKDDKKNDKKSCPCEENKRPCGPCDCKVRHEEKLVCNIKCQCECMVRKSEFFDLPTVKNNYEYFKGNMYKLKRKGVEIVKNAEYLEWDHQHSDVEIWSYGKVHQGCLCPRKLQRNLKRPAQSWRDFPY